MLAAVSSGKKNFLPELVHGGPKSLLAQASADPKRPQQDGWGSARWTASGPRLFLSARGVTADAAALRRETARLTGPGAALVHLRQASNPGKLPRRSVVTRANTQPFALGRHAFCHNGTLFIKDAVARFLGRYSGARRGSNDSEVLFLQALKMLSAYGGPVEALRMAVDEIRTIWLSCSREYPAFKVPFRGLNMFLCDGRTLAVMCGPQVRDDKGALLTRGWEYGRIAYRRTRDAVVFSSEPADAGRWEKMPGDSVALASLRGGRVDFELFELGR